VPIWIIQLKHCTWFVELLSSEGVSTSSKPLERFDHKKNQPRKLGQEAKSSTLRPNYSSPSRRNRGPRCLFTWTRAPLLDHHLRRANHVPKVSAWAPHTLPFLILPMHGAVTWG